MGGAREVGDWGVASMAAYRRELDAPTSAGAFARPVSPRISVVIPALNEAANLREVLPTLPRVHEVIVVDGGSVDGTVEAARELLPGVITITQARRGEGVALAPDRKSVV